MNASGNDRVAGFRPTVPLKSPRNARAYVFLNMYLKTMENYKGSEDLKKQDPRENLQRGELGINFKLLF